MNSGKSHAYFQWAAEHATVPSWDYVLPHNGIGNNDHGNQHHQNNGQPFRLDYGMDKSWLASGQVISRGNAVDKRQSWVEIDDDDTHPNHKASLPHNHAAKLVYTGERRPDYVVKADDDAFIRLDELERRLRVIPREKTFWGCKQA